MKRIVLKSSDRLCCWELDLFWSVALLNFILLNCFLKLDSNFHGMIVYCVIPTWSLHTNSKWETHLKIFVFSHVRPGKHLIINIKSVCQIQWLVFIVKVLCKDTVWMHYRRPYHSQSSDRTPFLRFVRAKSEGVSIRGESLKWKTQSSATSSNWGQCSCKRTVFYVRGQTVLHGK